MPLPVYTGPFGPAQAERLLWRAGFGPRPGEERVARRKGLDGAVAHLLTTGPDNLVGKAAEGQRPPAVPARQVRPRPPLVARPDGATSRPLTERMTLVWHDWFATSNETVGSQRLMIRQNNMFRRSGLGSFPGLVMRVTENPAMLLYLNGLESEKGAPNENYARELMELFTLGHGSGLHRARRARAGPGPDRIHGDVQERVRLGQVPLRPQPARRRDEGRLRQARPVRLEAGRELTIEHPAHKTFFTRKLWGYFIPEPADDETQAALEELYVQSGYSTRPVLSAILKHPRLYEGPRMVKPPAVYLAGMLRILGDRISTEDYVWLVDPGRPAALLPAERLGWNDDRWLDTSTFHARWSMAERVLQKHSYNPDHTRRGTVPSDPAKLVDRAVSFWGDRTSPTRPATRSLSYATKVMGAAVADDDRQRKFPPMTLNALRHLVAASPEMQTS